MLFTLLFQVVVVVLLLHLLSLPVFVSARHGSTVDVIQQNVRTVAPTGVVLGGILAANGLVRDMGVELSWLIGINITGYIHAVEGAFVARVQSLATPALTMYFSFVYVFGYVFLLTFPFVLYVLHEDHRPLYATLVAFILNYGLGLVCYVVFVSYGPRNFMPEMVGSLLYTSWPRAQLLTSQVNANTNVFPSLHTSLSVTVAFLAYRFRTVSWRWFPIATVGAASVTVSTMYLGIHWLTDVVGGILLAAVCVAVGVRMTTESHDEATTSRQETNTGNGPAELLRR